MNQRVAIIIPAFNEERTIKKIVQQALQFGTPIVVNDASTDRTREEAEQSGAVVVTHEKNRGYDGALQSGFEKAHEMGFELSVTMDADGQHNSALLQEFVRLLNEFDMVVGIRPQFARLSERVFSWYGRLRYGMKDPLCGMKGYRMSLYAELGHFDSFGSTGTELALYAARNRKQIKQIPIEIRDRVGASRFGQTLRGNYRIFRSLVLAVVKV